MEIISKYFPNLDNQQIDRFSKLPELYKSWNAKINVISRKDIDNIVVKHILHSLSISKFINFEKGTKILDLGTGGGFPAIPLAILFPHVEITAIDGTAKKISVVNEIINALELENIVAMQKRAEETKEKYHFVVSRAVASLDKLILWSEKLISKKQQNAIPNGLICLKGGNLKEETKSLKRYIEKNAINQYFEETYFAEKYVLYVQLS